MRSVLALIAVLAVAACGGLGPRAQLAAADQSFTVIVERLDRSCVTKQLSAERCGAAQAYVRVGRTALDDAYAAVNSAGGAGGGSNSGGGSYLEVVVSVTETLEAILAERTAP